MHIIGEKNVIADALSRLDANFMEKLPIGTGRQYARPTVPNVDIVGSSKCHTRYLVFSYLGRRA
jgi:hypothetical protein